LGLSQFQKKEAVKVKFQFDLTLIKKCYKQQNDRYHFFVDNQPADDPRKASCAMDNKSMFNWTARVKLEKHVENTSSGDYYIQQLSLTIDCPQDVEILNAKVFNIKNCNQCSSEPIIVTQDASKVWTVKKIYTIGKSSPLIHYILEADVYVQQSLESMLNMSESVVGLFENGKYTDLIFSVKNQKFRCHKAMLMEKSPVFEAMVRIHEFYQLFDLIKFLTHFSVLAQANKRESRKFGGNQGF
jgi:hypothetical protein